CAGSDVGNDHGTRYLPRLSIGHPFQLVQLIGNALTARVGVRAHHEERQALVGVRQERTIGRVRTRKVYGARGQVVPSQRALAVDDHLKLVDHVKMSVRVRSRILLIQAGERQVRVLARTEKWRLSNAAYRSSAFYPGLVDLCFVEPDRQYHGQSLLFNP